MTPVSTQAAASIATLELARNYSRELSVVTTALLVITAAAYLYKMNRRAALPADHAPEQAESSPAGYEAKGFKILGQLSFSYARPDPLEMTELACDVYDAVRFTRSGAELKPGGVAIKGGRWQRLKHCYDPETGYVGVAYKKESYIVVVHRGNTAFLRDWISMNSSTIAENKHGDQLAPAYQFVREAYQNILEGKKEYKNCSLTTAGHAHGGWLANMIAFHFADDLGIIIPAVAFDPSDTFQAMGKKDITHIRAEGLNIQSFYLTPKLVNYLDRPVGTCLQIVKPGGHSRWSLSNFMGFSHPMTEFMERMNDPDAIFILLDGWPSHGIRALAILKELLIAGIISFYLQSIPKYLGWRALLACIPVIIEVLTLWWRLNPLQTHGDGHFAHLITDGSNSEPMSKRSVHVRQLDQFLSEALVSADGRTINEEFVAFALQRARTKGAPKVATDEPNSSLYVARGTQPGFLISNKGIISLFEGEEVRPVLNELSQFAIPYLLSNSALGREDCDLRLSHPFAYSAQKKYGPKLKLFDVYKNIDADWKMAVQYVYALIDHIHFVERDDKVIEEKIGRCLSKLHDDCFYKIYQDTSARPFDRIRTLLSGFLSVIAEDLQACVAADFLMGLYTEAMRLEKEPQRRRNYFRHALICAAQLDSLNTLNGWLSERNAAKPRLAEMLAELQQAEAVQESVYTDTHDDFPLPKPDAGLKTKIFEPILYIRLFNAYGIIKKESIDLEEFIKGSRYLNYAHALSEIALEDYADKDIELLPYEEFKKWFDIKREQSRCCANLVTHQSRYANGLAEADPKRALREDNERNLYKKLEVDFELFCAIPAHLDQWELTRASYILQSSIFSALLDLACLKRDLRKYDGASRVFRKLLDSVRYLADSDRYDQKIRFDYVINLQTQFNDLLDRSDNSTLEARFSELGALFSTLFREGNALTEYDNLDREENNLEVRLVEAGIHLPARDEISPVRVIAPTSSILSSGRRPETDPAAAPA